MSILLQIGKLEYVTDELIYINPGIMEPGFLILIYHIVKKLLLIGKNILRFYLIFYHYFTQKHKK